ncbi:helix-turn-helix transcriptional regulator [Cellulosimicrobium arenosum]|uniref:Helix-turn-helix transcriptional regulator n=1 Tax=Cellulosimicrobium arenosum TaxID=2708133 RepID=A0A927G8F0_9MICO|nr:helix-turn-helix transcriptional regulator [Cellulosimicrobium arenosum]MBD8078357.1 helix-turn-helix transcriptional regulator [Cellulosimicrobium arenosum]
MAHEHTPPLIRNDVLGVLGTGDLDRLEAAFDALWFDLPDQFAHEVLHVLEALDPGALETRPRLVQLALLSHHRISHEHRAELGMPHTLQLYVEAGLRFGQRLPEFRRLPDLVAASTAAVIAYRHRRNYTTSERIGTWMDQYLRRGPASTKLPWSARQPPARPGWLSAQRGITAMLAGSLDQATELFTRAHAEAGGEPDAHYAGVSAASNLALLSSYRGHLDLARAWLVEFDRLPPFPSWIAADNAPGHSIARAMIAIEEGDQDTAADHLDSMRGTPHPVDLWPFLAFARASYHSHYGDPYRGLRELDETRLSHGILEPRADGFVRQLLLRAEAKLLLRAGGNSRVLHLAHENPDVDSLAVHHAWAHLAVDEHHDAQRLASRCLHEASLSPTDVMSMHLVLAVAHLRAGRDDQARTWFDSAVRQRATPDHVGPFLSMQSLEREKLADLTGAKSLLPGGAVPTNHNTPETTDSVRLTPREREVLHRLGEGYTAERTASIFGVSVNTVRTQIRSIYQKLGATSRKEALAIAQTIGLLRVSTAAKLSGRMRSGAPRRQQPHADQ